MNDRAVFRPRVWSAVAIVLLLAGCAAGVPRGEPVSAPTPEREAAVRKASAPEESSREAARPEPDGKVRFTILQMNDVYEITPVEGGRRGGLARVAALRQQLLEENPDTITVLAGDFVSPSALGTAKVDGERLAGRQMIATLNALGLDVAVIGNHEMDLDEQALFARIAESEFTWISTNVFSAGDGERFPGVDRWLIRTVGEGGSHPIRVAFVGPTLRTNEEDWVFYTEPISALKREVEALAGKADVIVALTHLSLAQDVQVADQIPEVDLVLGGHEHENIQIWRGSGDTPILKADANARTVYVHRIAFDPETGTVDIDSRLVPITEALPDEPETAAVVADWVERGYAGFRADGFEPEAVVVTSTDALDGREANIRNRATNLTAIVAAAYRAEVPGADLGLFNSGSIRVDDVLPAGPVTQYDVIRILPFGGIVQGARVKGSLLTKTLDAGLSLRGTGGFLQYDGVRRVDEQWEVGNQPIDPDRTYLVAVSDFLVAGRERGIEFFSPESPDLTMAGDFRDQRKVLIDELVRRYGAPPP